MTTPSAEPSEAVGEPPPAPTPGRDRLAVLYREHHAFVWRILKRLGVPRLLLEDALQNVFLVVHRRISDLHPRVPIRSWLFGIARRVAADMRRSRTRAERRLLAVPQPVEPRSPELEFFRSEASAFVDRFLRELDPEKRIVFVLADVEDMTLREVAAALGVNQNTVASRLRAARHAFLRAASSFDVPEPGPGGES